MACWMVPRLVVLLNFSTAVPIYFSREEETKDRRDYREEEENEWPRQFPAWPDIQPSCNMFCTRVQLSTAGYQP